VEQRRRNHWGWGFEDQRPSKAELEAQAAAVAAHLGFSIGGLERPVELAEAQLPQVRLRPPTELAEICFDDAHARASHAWGRSYADVLRGFRGNFEHAPDLVARPREERELEAVLEWCERAGAAAIPYGGGTSVVGGVEARVGARFQACTTIDLGALDRVLEVDCLSRAARIQAGARGPVLESQLAEHGLTLRHFPQSFELSTLGGWIATRAGGHFATLWTHIEDLLESVRAVTPRGVWESRRLPGSGAGVSPDRMLAGSEGILGVITEAWVRVQPKPTHRAQTAVRFDGFMRGAQCVQELSQTGLHPSNCRLIDPLEAQTTLAGDGAAAVLVLGFESTDHEVGSQMDRALEICGSHGGSWEAVRAGGAQGASSSWREAFLRAPYLRDLLVAMGIFSETFETAITWERFPALHERVIAAATDAAIASSAGATVRGAPRVSCRFTHIYPDGPAPYFTVLAPARDGEEIEQWRELKQAISDAVLAEGATITHHHAVGREHRPWYDEQRPEPFAAALRAAKAAVDPSGIMNPGVLVDPL
jgi:alkyldihydroxyacetonephosphate synthase